MGKTYQISKAEAAVLKEYRKKTKDKLTDRRLYAVQLRAEGIRNKDVAEKLDVSPKQVSHWCSLYINGGIEALLPHPRSGRPPKLSYESH